MSDQPATRARRSDAIANRARLLDAAGAVIAENGVDAPMHDIADRAGVGIGTLYRHFADRHVLLLGLDAILASSFRTVLEDSKRASTGWESFTQYVDGTWQMYLDLPWAVAVREYANGFRERDLAWEESVRAIIQRAKGEGSMRGDIEWTDALFVPAMLTGLAALTEPIRGTVFPRQRDILLDGFRAEGIVRRAPGGVPITDRALRDYVSAPESVAHVAE
ncbi:TetR/AcrR family transcriptional regulator [Microbacterium sp. NPDC076911]|uniref:TetR/AcrR family transcriptional regulator n=1 Tax=Microbacterium sp. NPDC076911 TaxID=3154958 RepID=UPI00341A6E43